MALSISKKTYMQELCKTFRQDVLRVLYDKQTGHPGGSLSVCEILTTLYFHAARIDPGDPQQADRDRIILSKGHAAPMLYRVLAEKGFFPVDEMNTLRDFETRLQGHPSVKHTPGVELSTGPLGLGLSASLGMALGLKLDGSPARVYVVLGDGEINEGTIWEACMCAAKYKADNLIAVLDWNGVQLDGLTDEVMPTGNLPAKFREFGWHCLECDGHDISDLCETLDKAATLSGRPVMILARTVKGKGVSFMEGQSAWHGRPVGKDEYAAARQELEGENV